MTEDTKILIDACKQARAYIETNDITAGQPNTAATAICDAIAIAIYRAQARDARVRRLICSCCGAETHGRQWHNRDTGYGLCEACDLRVQEKMTAAEHQRCYGIRGLNYSTQEGAKIEAKEEKLFRSFIKKLRETEGKS